MRELPMREFDDDRLRAAGFGPVHWFEQVDSTNRHLLAAAADGAPEGLVAVADEQRAGRGRLGRTWVAPPGASLLVSVLLRPDLPPEQLHVVTLAAALAARDAVRQVADVDARIKWPNDVVVDDRKLAGILAEASGGAVVVGMGLNVAWPEFPDDIAATATALDRHRATAVDRMELLVAWLIALRSHLDAPGSVVSAAAAASATLGRRVRVELPDGVVSGTARALTAEGYLVLTTDDGDDVTVTAGDVVHLRPDRGVAQ
jgi:BirA family biotin operon repressor/biotin-[acetyl-CoA-carboxylase] ligase